MAVREFDGVDDVVRCGVGAANVTGAFTVAALVRKTRDARTEVFVASHTSGGSPSVLLGADGYNYLLYSVNGWGGRSSVKFYASQGWHLCVITKESGDSNVRVHLRQLSASTWSHQPGTRATNSNPVSTSGGSWRFGNTGAGNFGASRLAVAGVWNSAMSDAQVEALGANRRTRDWLEHAAGAPRALWDLNQDSVQIPVADLTGGGAGQVAITGTTVVTNDDPPGWTFGAETAPPPAGTLRKDIYSLTSGEWDRFVQALQSIKSSGTYDAFTRRHHEAMMALTLYPGETGTQRNVAHRGPSFLPWHRQSLKEFEDALQRVDASVTLPYWRWEGERASWPSGQIWQMIGGNGSSAQGYRVTTGPFSGWTSVIWNDPNQRFDPRAGIIRRWWADPMPDVSPAQSVSTYDVSPWRENSDPSRSFRNRLEGYHNAFHTRIGGDMSAGTAPNDPVFWLHHANIDRLWAQWQVRWGMTSYQPTSGGPPSHNLNDVMPGLVSSSTTPASVLDWRQLGYSYDVLESGS